METHGVIRESPFVRTHYYPGKLLHAGDLINEQEYGNCKLEFINRMFHGCGIIEGLEVRVRSDGRLELTAGSAIDPRGRILLAPRDTVWGLDDIAGPERQAGREFVLGIRYAERPVEQEQVREDGGGISYRTARIEETFALGAYPPGEWRFGRDADGRQADWIPLACLRAERSKTREGYVFSKADDRDIRSYAQRERIPESLPRGGRAPSQEETAQPETLREETASGHPGKIWEKQTRCVRTGILTIPIPEHYKRGQVLLSEEISHGFPGEEVWIRWGVMYRQPGLLFRDTGKDRYAVIRGDQSLFEDRWGGDGNAGWDIARQALRQDVERGTFRIALTLSGGRRKYRRYWNREVVISWMVFRIGRTERSCRRENVSKRS
ncbi:MAG: hypothetical protein NC079_02665 [Clostridium sp.]|nr:hypothetical protein [Acetatifactor muris]MCM1527183.1 hypothetical protein [Bacteroides sp.]MCM1562492.1 hypothetical protein [Clostridium sp.]